MARKSCYIYFTPHFGVPFDQFDYPLEGTYFRDVMVTIDKKNECECQLKFVLRESSNVYTRTPYSGQGQYEPLVSTRIPRINWHHSWLFELTRRHS